MTRQQRRQTPPPKRGASPRSGWRATFDAYGGGFTLAIAGGVVFMVVMLIIGNRPRSGSSSEAYVPRERAVTVGRIWGRADAPVKIVEYGDYQCPHCRTFWLSTEPQLREFIDNGVASLEFRDLVILGPESHMAAEAAACAAKQDLFWPMHDVLYLRQGQERSGVYSAGNVKEYARQAADGVKQPLDGSAFDRCIDQHEQRADVLAMSTQATGLGLTSTPSVTVDGQLVTGPVLIDAVRAAINTARGYRQP